MLIFGEFVCLKAKYSDEFAKSYLLSSRNSLSNKVYKIAVNNMSIEVYYKRKNSSLPFVNCRKNDNLVLEVV